MPGAYPQPFLVDSLERSGAGHHETPANPSESKATMIRASKRHLAQVQENYFEHMSAALGFSLSLARASVACGIHAIVPALCTRTASRSVAALQAKLVMRAAVTGTAGRSDGDRVRIDT